MAMTKPPFNTLELERLIAQRQQKSKEDMDRLLAAKAKQKELEAFERRMAAEGAYASIQDKYTGYGYRKNSEASATGTTRVDDDFMRSIFVGPGKARGFFRYVELVPHRDAVRGEYQGTWYEADAMIAERGGWWKEVSALELHMEKSEKQKIPAKLKQETTMKQFSKKVLEQGQYDELEKIQTPKPGEQFDMNQLSVAGVLTLNKMVDVIEAMQKKIEELEAEIVGLQKRPAVEPEQPFRLRKIGDNYEDVRETA